MPLGTEIGLGPGDIVLDGDPAHPPHRNGHSSPPLFGPLCSGTFTHLGKCWGLVFVPYWAWNWSIAAPDVRYL